MVVHPANTPWQVLPAVANGMGSREQDFPAPTTRVGSPTFITKTGQEPNMGSASCLQAVGVECGLIGGECGLTGSSIGTECEPETTPVCEPECHCLQAATTS